MWTPKYPSEKSLSIRSRNQKEEYSYESDELDYENQDNFDQLHSISSNKESL